VSSESKLKRELKIESIDPTQLKIISRDGYGTYATIRYERGNWLIYPSNRNYPIKINGNSTVDSKALEKYDKICVANNTFHWSDYLIEENNQTLHKKDFLSVHGRINRANFRALSIMISGLIPVIYLAPGLVLIFRKRRRFPNPTEDTELILAITPYVHTVGFTLLAMLTILISIKRMRDTGYQQLNLLIPLWNLKLLLFSRSRQRHNG